MDTFQLIYSMIRSGRFLKFRQYLKGSNNGRPQMSKSLFIILMMLLATYQPLRAQDPPSGEWFDEAKFGIMIHWGLYTVPAYAPKVREYSTESTAAFFLMEFLKTLNVVYAANRVAATSPYAEWYWNSMQFPFETGQFHKNTFGENFSYDDFKPMFEDSMKLVDPNKWAAYFKELGAKYVVLVTKHHDGYQLWPSNVVNNRKPNYFSERDFVGELGEACRAQDLIYGLYYSGGLDWIYRPRRIDVRDWQVFLGVGGSLVPEGSEYAQYCDAQMRELVDRYKPAVLWNDIGYPKEANAQALYDYYKQVVPYGLFNNRYYGSGVSGDFDTPEYAEYDEPRGRKWETCRGMTLSFGYNRADVKSDIIGKKELRMMFTRIIANGGNLLLNLPITASGEIYPMYREVLDEFGAWMKTNQEAIYKSTYRTPSSTTSSIRNGKNVFFTIRENNTYLFFTENIQANQQVTVFNFNNQNNAPVSVLGSASNQNLEWQNEGGNMVIRFNNLEGLTYPVVVRIGNSLGGTTTSISESDLLASKFKVFPNPTNGTLKIDGAAEDLKMIDRVSVFNSSGQVMKVFNKMNLQEIDIYDLPIGLYIVELSSQNTPLSRHRVVKN